MQPYSLILADPPWHFENWSADKPGQVHNRGRGAASRYPCARVEDICALRPPVARDCVLFMWYVASNLEDALKVCQAWGFTYKTKGWTWVKLAKNGKPRMGQGYIVRHATEDCLIATRGKVGRPQYKSELDLIFAPFDPVHSRKPAEQYAKIDRLYPDLWPRLEMFARETQPGWDVFGNQVDGSIDVSPSRIQLSFV